MPPSTLDDDAEPLSLRDLEVPASSQDPSRADVRRAPPDRPTEPVSLRELEIVDDGRGLSFDDADPVPMGGLERMLAPGAMPRSISGGELEAVMRAAVSRGEPTAPAREVGAQEAGAGAQKVGAQKVGAQKVGAQKVGAQKVAAQKVAAQKVAAQKVGAQKVGAPPLASSAGSRDEASEEIGFLDLAHDPGTHGDDEHVSLDELFGAPAAHAGDALRAEEALRGSGGGPDSVTSDLRALGSRSDAEKRRDERLDLASLAGGGLGSLGSPLDAERLLMAPPPSDPAMDPAPLSSRGRARRAVPIATRSSSAPPPRPTPSPPARTASLPTQASAARAAPTERPGRAKRAVLGLSLVSLGAAAAFAVMRASSTSAPSPAATGASSPSAAREPSPLASSEPAPSSAASAPTTDATTQVTSAPSSRASAPLVVASPGPTAALTPSSAAQPSPAPSPSTAPAAAPSASATTAPPPPTTGGPFDKAAAQAALAGAASRAAACPADSFANVTVAVTFVPSGRSTTANLEGGPFGGTPTGECIVRAFRGLSVPPFEGDPVRVRKSFGVGK
jgi:hypothetical protein